MWPYNDIENKWIAGINPHADRLTTTLSVEIELAARQMRNRMLFESIAAILSPIGRAAAFLAYPLTSWWTRTRVYDELMGMDDRLLADIGISRADIPDVTGGRYQQVMIRAPRLAAEQVNRVRRAETPVAHNDHATPRVA
jgi:uncharacterized protein YjiS (DUF1127 family)